MPYRNKMSKGRSRRSFRRGSRTNTKNFRSPIMRGGIRL